MSAEPRLDVLNSDANVMAESRLGAGALGRLQHHGRVDAHVVAQPGQLIRRRHPIVEHLSRNLDEGRMGDPGPVVALADLTQLVGAHFVERDVVRARVVLDRNLCRHAPHRVSATAVARTDEELHVRAQKWRLHRHLTAVRENEGGIGPKRFDRAEDVVPSAAVESHAVIFQFVQNLSISKAAGSVSMRTVALIVPRGSPSADWA